MKKFIAVLSASFIIAGCSPVMRSDFQNCSITASAEYADEDYDYGDYDGEEYDSEDEDYTEYERDVSSDDSTDNVLRLIISLVIGIVVGAVTVGILKSQLKTVKFQHGADNYEKKGSFVITNHYDRFLYKKTEKRPINRN